MTHSAIYGTILSFKGVQCMSNVYVWKKSIPSWIPVLSDQHSCDFHGL